MGSKVLVLLGTKKGGFILESDESRTAWRVRGPLCDGWSILHMSYDPASGAIYAAGGSEWYGPAVWKSTDLGATWTHSSEGITYGDGGPPIRKLWHVVAAHGAVYAGADPAGLFRSDDGGVTWTHVQGLRQHPTSPDWQPGNGGLCLHTIVPHPRDPARMWVAISAVGTFSTADGGQTWQPRNRGVRADYLPDRYPEVGQCVHKLVMAPSNPALLYQQNHCGVYRSQDGGEHWEEISRGLPSDFGFPIAVHPRDPQTIYVIPLDAERGRVMPEGKAAVWRSRNGGATWQRQATGLPQERAFLSVLREAMAMDTCEPAGVYFGTSTGQLFASRDEGATWELQADYLPPIWSVETAVLEA